jgi:hypothetical protein
MRRLWELLWAISGSRAMLVWPLVALALIGTSVPLLVLAGLILGAIGLVVLVPMFGMRALGGGWEKTTRILRGDERPTGGDGTDRGAPSTSRMTRALIGIRSRRRGR